MTNASSNIEHGGSSRTDHLSITTNAEVPTAGLWSTVANTPPSIFNGENVRIETTTDITPRQKKIAVFSLSSCTLLIALETTMTAIIGPEIKNQLGGDFSAVFAIATIYLLGAAACQPVWAEISHVTGRKQVLMTGLMFYIIGSIISATCTKITPLFIGRVLQGIGGAAPTALPPMILADMFTLAQRTLWQAVFNLLWAIGSILGPIVAGLMLSRGKSNWRGAIWLEVGLAIVSFIAVAYGVKTTRPSSNIRTKICRIDWFGILLTIPTILLCFFPLTCGGGLFDWASWPIIASFAAGYGVFLPLLYCHQRFWRKDPMFRKELFSDKTTVIGFSGSLVSGALLWMLLIYLTFFYKYVRMLPALKVAVQVLPETLTFVPTLLVAALVIKRFQRYRWANMIGWPMTTLGFGLLQLMSRTQPNIESVAINMVPGIGLGLLFAGLIPTIQAAVHPHFRAHATSMTILMRSTGQAMGVAIGGTIFTSSLKPAVERYHLGSAYELINELTQDGEVTSSLDERIQVLLLNEIEKSMRPIWLCGCVLAGVMTLFMLFLRVAPMSTADVVPESEAQADSVRHRARAKKKWPCLSP